VNTRSWRKHDPDQQQRVDGEKIAFAQQSLRRCIGEFVETWRY
jgi:hypothetical protein